MGYLDERLPDEIAAGLPPVPALVRGAVLPVDRAFFREKESVEASAMEDMIRSNMAGHEATVAALGQVREAVLGSRMDDDQIGRAARRYEMKMAVIRGGV